jgi:hypothetical protein
MHDVAPERLYRPAGQMAHNGVDVLDAAWHAYPALQLRHVVHPSILNLPALHVRFVGTVDPAPGHT